MAVCLEVTCSNRHVLSQRVCNMETHVVRGQPPGHGGRSHDSPMRWAIDQETGTPVYVGTLRPAQNGNACGCRCPACHEPLQAVNADKPSSHFEKHNTRWKFFRHPSGHQRSGCSLLAANLAALHLLMDRNEIDLPAPRQRGLVLGLSGTPYLCAAHGERWRGQVMNRVWLDSQSGLITLADGKTVLVSLSTRTELSRAEGVEGRLTIHVDDPEVASWSPEAIMEALQLDGQTACWDSHWDDERLAAEAERLAQAQAGQVLDHWPSELAHLVGLSLPQRMETVLHATVKDILASAGGMQVPALRHLVTREMDDGSQRQRAVAYPSQHLVFSDVRLETPFLDMVPDVMCSARSTRNTTDHFELLIEVAVTHKVDARKRDKIVAAGMPCIEIDLTQLGLAQRTIGMEQLRSAVLNATTGKSWVFNPWFEQQVLAHQQAFAAEDRVLRQHREQEMERLAWLAELGVESLLEMWLPVLRQHWQHEPAVLVDEDHRVWPGEIEAQLASKGFPEAEAHLLTMRGGLLACLDQIEQSHLDITPLGASSVLWQMEDHPRLRCFVTLALMAAKVFRQHLTGAEQGRLTDLRRRVQASLNGLGTEFARPSTYDALIARLFPAMADLLRQPYGTLEAVMALVQAKAMEEQALAMEAKRVREEAAAQVAAEARRMEQQRVAVLEAKRARKDMAYAAVRRDLRLWGPGQADSLEKLLAMPAVVRMARNYARSELDVNAVLQGAWKARAKRIPVAHWFDALDIEETGRAKMVVDALKTAGLLS